MRILIIATPVAPLGESVTGGVSLLIEAMAKAFALSGHAVDIVAMDGSRPVPQAQMIPVQGTPQPSLASSAMGGMYPIPPNAALAHFWRAALQRQSAYDVVINTAHDWLPYYVSPFFTTPVLHIVNMGDVNATTTAIIRTHVEVEPLRVAFLSKAQAQIFTTRDDATVLPLGIDMADYQFQATSQGRLVWAGRISPEKGLEDALEVARRCHEKLVIAGGVDDAAYWQALQNDYPDHMDYRGLLNRDDLQACLGEGRALLQTQKWDEAFGLVTIEALACGTPVIAYDRGANTELVTHRKTGFLITPDAIDDIIRILPNIAQIDRQQCRAAADTTYALPAFAQRLEEWCHKALTDAA